MTPDTPALLFALLFVCWLIGGCLAVCQLAMERGAYFDNLYNR